MIKLLITDLDDTLYSWIGFFIPAFYAMVDELSVLLGQDKVQLIKEYQAVHKEKGSVEYPYATTYLPSVKKAYPNYTQEQLVKTLNPAFHRFNSVRKERLKLYPHVEETLASLFQKSIKVVGYTESAEENGFYRLKKLGVDKLFHAVYVSDSQYDRPRYILSSPKTKIVSGKKPNPKLLREICQQESVLLSEAIYIGDSLTKDIYMAKEAGIISIQCKYPCNPEETKKWYDQLVAISHWTNEDFRQEAELKRLCQEKAIIPDYVIDSFDEVGGIIAEINKT